MSILDAILTAFFDFLGRMIYTHPVLSLLVMFSIPVLGVLANEAEHYLRDRAAKRTRARNYAEITADQRMRVQMAAYHGARVTPTHDTALSEALGSGARFREQDAALMDMLNAPKKVPAIWNDMAVPADEAPEELCTHTETVYWPHTHTVTCGEPRSWHSEWYDNHAFQPKSTWDARCTVGCTGECGFSHTALDILL